MSYILDALKKADAARERGQVPGLHSHHLGAAAAPPAPARPGRGTGVLVAGLVVLLLIAAAGWWWQSARRADVATAAPAVATPTAPVDAPRTAPPTTPNPPQALVVVAAPVAPILAPEPPPPPQATAQRSSVEPNQGATVKAGPAPAAKPALPPEPRAASTPVRSFAELPTEVRAQLPQVNISGSTYSSNPAHRMLIVDGKVAHEGEEIAPGLQLESIGLRNAVLNHRGTRYSIGY